MIAAVTGGRDLVITPEICRAFWHALEIRAGIRVLRHGDARGADRWAAGIAAHRDIVIEPWPADWERHGRSAGAIRNRRMLVGPAPVSVLLALPGGRGTADCVAAAHELRIPVVSIGETCRCVGLAPGKIGSPCSWCGDTIA